MLVLKYGIECDLLQAGNIRVADGEIEITSEDFLRELEDRLNLELDVIRIATCKSNGFCHIIAQYTAFELEEEFVCLRVAMSRREELALYINEMI